MSLASGGRFATITSSSITGRVWGLFGLDGVNVEGGPQSSDNNNSSPAAGKGRTTTKEKRDMGNVQQRQQKRIEGINLAL